MRRITRSRTLLLISLLFWACEKKSSSSPSIHPVPKGDTFPMYNNVQLLTNSGVGIGNSIIAGFPWRLSGLELGIPSLPDTAGQICWYLSRLTKFNWIDRGWSGQTTVQIRARFLRDAIGDSSDPGDGLGAVTLSRKPSFVVMEGGVNDILYHLPLSQIEDNLAWMASTCRQNHIHCIVLNCIGYGVGFDSTQTQMISQLNDWFGSGALDSVQARIVDINSLWNSGIYGGISPYGNDNIHYSSLVYPGDGIHFTPVGYDSVAHAIFRVAKLAPISKIVH